MAAQSPLVLREFHVDETAPGLDAPLVRIVGRPEGIMSFLLTAIGLGAPTEFVVTRRSVNFKHANLMGASQTVSPITHVSSAYGGYSKPFQHLVFGALFLFGGLSAAIEVHSAIPFLIGLIVGGILLVLYYLRKTLTVGIWTTSGVAYGLSFKRSVIEGKAIEFEDAMRVVNLVRDVVLDAAKSSEGARKAA